MNLDGRSALVIIGDWNWKFGATFDMTSLIELLLAEGVRVKLVVTQRKVPSLFGFQDSPAGLAMEALNNTSMGIGRVIAQAAKSDVVFVVGQRPRFAYVLMQAFSKVVFMQFDTKLTCPVSGKICEMPCGISCFSITSEERCLGRRSFLQKLSLIVKRSVDMKMLRFFRNFAVNSETALQRFGRKGVFFHPPIVIAPPVSVAEALKLSGHIAFVGRLEKMKGCSDALHVFAKSRTANHLHVIGDGRLRAALEQEAATLEIADRVSFHGWLNPTERHALVARCDLSLMTSKWDEAFGRIGPESFAAGTPVVAYDAGGIDEWCIAPAGTLVGCSDITGAAAAIDRILDDDTRLAEAVSACRNDLDRLGDAHFKAAWRSYLADI
jgi:glycosyltransferase involved in cell wall biosynthesis